MDEKSLLVQIEQKEKAYATLMDQFNKLQEEMNQLQEFIKGQIDDIETLRERLESKTAVIDSINATNAEYINVIHNWERKASEYEQKIDSLKEALEDALHAKEEAVKATVQTADRGAKELSKLNGEKNELEIERDSLKNEVDHMQKQGKAVHRAFLSKVNEAENFADANAHLRVKNERFVSAIVELFKTILEDE